MGEANSTIPKELEKKVKKIKNVKVMFGYDETQAHQAYAGSDILLMSSLFEPCGLDQMCAMRYGTVPVVHSAGGIIDTVDPFSPKDGSGDGFLFEEYTTDAAIGALGLALSLFSDRKAWQALATNIMAKDCSWTSSAIRYVEQAYAS